MAGDRAFGEELPNEHPDVTAASRRNVWLAHDTSRLRPATLLEFLEETNQIAAEWWGRWNELWKKVNPNFFRNKEDRDRWLREQELKSLAAWHVWRAMRIYWHEAGLWVGNPMDPTDKGTFVLPAFEKPPRKRKR